ncbi:gamma carbonic anhydrase family protein [Tenggerimyces flavus]|uniref:Gamma carbonic anhydrase family protein n=1 Tax=Tenggerimyces flavus TaxID=1708749 RepID=A0ABV7YA13_9ACTN|nr:gamma carbonic anhydrase family protein [Tenggerimyces flavus]MBM7789002.1 carbonic anhydrase/acetyltransferase-like protein (isoleucine patch superfamily) [Tenggerimyces flavus]
MDRPLILPVNGHTPSIAASAFVAPGAVVTGQLTLAEQSSVWFGVTIRADSAPISIGASTNVQDGSVLHADPGHPCHVGARVTIGHAAVVHGAVVEDDCLIAIGARVLNGAVIGAGSLVGAGAVVSEGALIPPGSLVLGVPGKVRRDVSDAERERMARGVANYVKLAETYRAALA